MGARLILVTFVFMLSSTALFAQTPTTATGGHTESVGLTAAASHELRRLQAADAARIERRRNDSVLNGALIGAGAGVASGLLLCRTMEPWDVCNDPGPLVTYAALGAGIGIAIDALFREREVVRLPTGTAHVSLAPAVGRGSKGLRVALRF